MDGMGRGLRGSKIYREIGMEWGYAGLVEWMVGGVRGLCSMVEGGIGMWVRGYGGFVLVKGRGRGKDF